MYQRSRKKILFFAQDGVGLGHTRRLSRIAEYLQKDSSTLMVSGKREISWILSKNCEFIHIPSWQSVGLGAFADPAQSWLESNRDSAVALIRNLCQSIERSYAPDCIVVDHTLGGMYGELHELMISSRAKKIMIMRGITDTEDARRFESNHPSILNAYDAILVASDPKTSDFRPEDSRIPSFVPKTHHVGYVLPDKPDGALVRALHGVKDGQSWIVCSAGGGTNADDFLRHCTDRAARFPQAFFSVVLGPYSSIDAGTLPHYDNLMVHRVSEDLPAMHGSCDIAVVNGGYNSLFESIVGGSHILVFPNQSNPEGDQVTHATRLAQYYPITLLQKKEGLDSALEAALAAVKQATSPTLALDVNGLENIRLAIYKILR